MRLILIVIFLSGNFSLVSQSADWLQHADYQMEIDMDVENYQFTGNQKLVYTNNSPDTLHRVFYHLYFNAFQPGSMMDIRSRTIRDPDPRVGDRISKLKPDEIGYHRIIKFSQDGKEPEFKIEGTVMEVELAHPIPPGKSSTFEMEFESQVPVQIRRSGRNNDEGISLSMSQWYPKMAEYDPLGWHAHPYVGREFHGVWGEFDVEIKIDRDYVVAATGILQNPEDVGHGYSDKKPRKKLFGSKKLCWKFKAEKVHDFVWAADPDYTHWIKETEAGTKLHYFFQAGEHTTDSWKLLHSAMNEAEQYMNKNYGEYPYPSYAFIQGGDGGMEYAMATLITGERSFPSLVGVSIHEWLHSWYQMVLATNESLYAWMDEGFTSFASAEVMNHLKQKGIIPGEYLENPHLNTVQGFARWAATGKDEALSTHADHFTTNQAYGVAAYTKGSVFLKQLAYIIGEKDFYDGLLKYYKEYQFKHPDVNDFIRVMEKVSGIELDWYKEYWVNSTHTIDYGIRDVKAFEGGTYIDLEKIGKMPMPIDLTVVLEDGNERYFYIPLSIMRCEKSTDIFSGELQPDWPWTHPYYLLFIPDVKFEEIASIHIDRSIRFSDVNYNNNTWPQVDNTEGTEEQKN